MWKLFLVTLLLSICGISTTSPSNFPEKIQFTRQDACFNDGSVEFCIPKDDAQAINSVEEIAPTVTCFPSGGRARCDTQTEMVCLVSTDAFCTGQTISSEGWQTIQELATLPFIQKIVPTFYE